MVEVERIRRSVVRFGDRFLYRIFTEGERRYCAAKHTPEQSLASRFAAKEAAAKALGTGMSQGVTWRDLEVVRTSGAPSLLLHGESRKLAARLGVHRNFMSLTHTQAHATAVVLFEDGGEPHLPHNLSATSNG